MVTLVGVLIVVHALITFGSAQGALAAPPPAPGTGSLPGAGWFPFALGQSWLFEGSAVRIGGVIWLAAAVGLIATAAAVFGFVLPTSAWRGLALASSVTALVALVTFFHPYYLIGILANVALLAAVTFMEPTSRRLLGI